MEHMLLAERRPYRRRSISSRDGQCSPSLPGGRRKRRVVAEDRRRRSAGHFSWTWHQLKQGSVHYQEVSTHGCRCEDTYCWQNQQKRENSAQFPTYRRAHHHRGLRFACDSDLPPVTYESLH